MQPEAIQIAVVHEDREAELPAADDQHRHDKGQRIGPQRIERDGNADHDPGMHDAEDSGDIRSRANCRHFFGRETGRGIETFDVHRAK